MLSRLYYNIGVIALSGAAFLASCSSDETYAEQKEKEANAINNFLSRDVKITDAYGDVIIDVGRINPISEETFKDQGYKTYTESNQYVQFGSGVYMQIVREGVGEKLESGKSMRIMARYTEFNIMGDSIQSTNDNSYEDSPWMDVMEVSNSYGTFTASFLTTGYRSKMYTTYGSASVPAGWLTPLTYIRVGRQTSAEQISKVRLIVPHSQGQSDASNNVYPCFYEIKYQKMRD